MDVVCSLVSKPMQYVAILSSEPQTSGKQPLFGPKCSLDCPSQFSDVVVHLSKYLVIQEPIHKKLEKEAKRNVDPAKHQLQSLSTLILVFPLEEVISLNEGT